MSSKKPSIVLDSSAWVEILTLGPKASACQKHLNSAGEIIVPTLVLFEVHRVLAAKRSEDLALQAASILLQYESRDLTPKVALHASGLSLHHSLSAADAIVLAHALHEEATLITLDNDFRKVANVTVL